MGTGVSLILIAVGAILTWAVNATVSGIDINAVGVILMVVGAVGLLLSLMFWSTWGGFGTTTTPPSPPLPGRMISLTRRWVSSWTISASSCASPAGSGSTMRLRCGLGGATSSLNPYTVTSSRVIGPDGANSTGGTSIARTTTDRSLIRY